MGRAWRPAPRPRYPEKVRYFLTGRAPKVNAILLVESGSRGLVEGVIPGLRDTWGRDLFIDLVTCYASLPKGFEPHNTRVYRVTAPVASLVQYDCSVQAQMSYLFPVFPLEIKD